MKQNPLHMSSKVDLRHLLGVKVNLPLLDIRKRALLFGADHQLLSTGEIEDFHLLHNHLMTDVGDGLHLRAGLLLGLDHLLFFIDLLLHMEENIRGTEDLLGIYLKNKIGMLFMTPFTFM